MASALLGGFSRDFEPREGELFQPCAGLLASLLLAGAAPQTEQQARSAATSDAPRWRASPGRRPWLPTISCCKAVRDKSAAREGLRDVHARDRLWIENPRDPLRRALSTGACAPRLRALAESDRLVAEAILMDAQGANVCVSEPTTDYRQGDEAKFQKTVGAGKGVFVDEPACDASSGTFAIQLSVSVKDGGARIGAPTLTLRLRSEDVQDPAP